MLSCRGGAVLEAALALGLGGTTSTGPLFFSLCMYGALMNEWVANTKHGRNHMKRFRPLEATRARIACMRTLFFFSSNIYNI